MEFLLQRMFLHNFFKKESSLYVLERVVPVERRERRLELGDGVGQAVEKELAQPDDGANDRKNKV